MSQLNRVSMEPSEQPARPWLKNYPDCVPESLKYPQEPVWRLLDRAATEWGDRDACIYYDERLTFSRVYSRARRIAGWLVSQGLQPGERVGILLPNTPEYLYALNGIWMAGGTAVALSPLFVPEEAASFHTYLLS